MSNKNLRDYINLVEERGRTDRGYDPTVNPHAAADAARASSNDAASASAPPAEIMSKGQQARWKTKNPELARLGPDQYQRWVEKNSPTTTTGTSAKPSKQPHVKNTAPPAGAKAAPKAGAQAAKAAPKAGAQAAKGQATPSYDAGQYGYKSPEEIQQIQSTLNSMGYQMPVDGKWGPKTDAAYKQAYSQMYGQQPGQASQPAAASAPPQGKPDAWTQARLAKQGQSADMAAAVGMPNPNVNLNTPTAQPRGTTDKNSPFYIPPNAALDRARAKAQTNPRYDNLYDPMGVHAGSKSLEESDLVRIKDLINYKK